MSADGEKKIRRAINKSKRKKTEKNVSVEKINITDFCLLSEVGGCPRWLAAAPHGWSAPEAF